jgi:hypothetical protein
MSDGRLLINAQMWGFESEAEILCSTVICRTEIPRGAAVS